MKMDMKDLIKYSNVVIANKNQSVRCTIPKDIVEVLDITTGDKMKWTLDVKTEQIVLELVKDLPPNNGNNVRTI